MADTFVSRNAGLAVGIARKLFPHGDPRAHNSDDYVGAAMLGLWEAFLQWDPAQSSFGHFAQRYVFGQVGRAVRATEAAEISYGDFSARPLIRNVREDLASRLGRSPTNDEVAEAAGVPVDLVARVSAARPASLDAPVNEDGGTLGDITPGPADGDPADGALRSPTELLEDGDVDFLREALAGLNGPELWVLCRRHGLDGAPTQALTEIGYDLERGRQSVQRLSARAMDRLSTYLADVDVVP